MERASDGRMLVSLDTSVLINFLRLGRLDLLIGHPDWRFVVTDHVVSEVSEATLGMSLLGCACFLLAKTHLAQDPHNRVKKLVDDALFQRNDRVVGYVNTFRANFGAALSNVAESDACLLFDHRYAVGCIFRMHFQSGHAH